MSGGQAAGSPQIRVALACLAVIGIILAFRTPPLGGFDEPFHWRRALQLASLHPWATRLGPNDWGGRLDQRAMRFETTIDQAISAGRPLSIPELRALSDQLATTAPSQAMTSFPSTASFSPVAYLPAAAGILAARIAGLGPLTQLQAGRLCNLACYLLLVWCIVLVLPVGRMASLALLTVPTCLHLAASFSADPLCNALPALLVACCLRLRLEPGDPPPRFWRTGLLTLALLVGLLKPICFLLSGAILLVPAARFSNARAALGFRAASIALCLAVAVGWNLAYPFVPGRYWHTGAEPRAAVHALLGAPWHGVAMLARNGWNDRWFWWVDGWGRFGGGPGPYHFTVPVPLAAAFLAALLGLAVCDRGTGRSRPGVAAFLALLAVGYTAALLLAFRIGYGPPLSDFIDGVQGRYLLLPEELLLLALALALPSRLQAPRLSSPLLLACLLLDLGAAIVALGHEAAVWH